MAISLKLPQLSGMLPKVSLVNDSKPFSPNCLLQAVNDLAAVDSWLNNYQDVATTYKSYKLESERFILWCTYYKGKTFAELTKDDCEQYLAFLQNPPSAWCMPRNSRQLRGTMHWRPFCGPLSVVAVQKALRIINSLLNYLVDADYLRANPLKLIKQTRKLSIDLEEYKYQVWERMLEDDEWQAVQEVLNELPEDSRQAMKLKLTIQLLFSMLYCLGLRINEVATHNWNAFRYFQESWWFFVKGKGGKSGHIPVNDTLLTQVKLFRLHLGMQALPSAREISPIFKSNKKPGAATSRWLYSLVKQVGKKTALKFPNQPIKQRKLEKLSPHWLRHLSASHQDKLGVPLSVIQANHRHASNQTTQIYVHASDKQRVMEMQKLAMEVRPNIVEPENNENPNKLEFTLSGGGVAIEYSLKRIITILETKLLKGISFSRNFSDTDEVVDKYMINKNVGKKLSFSYLLAKDVTSQQIQKIKQQLKFEAEARLFYINDKYDRS